MMQRSVVATLLIIAIWVAFDACFVLRDTEVGLVTRVGAEPRAVVAAGLHFKAPFASALTRVDSRLRLHESGPHPRAFPDGRSELVSALVGHRVVDVSAYVPAFADEVGLEALLDELARKEIASDKVEASLRADLRSRGVAIVFVTPRRIEPQPSERAAVLSSMIEEHVRVAESLRARAEEEVASVHAATECERSLLLSEARREALSLRTRADVESAAIYAAAYRKDPALAELLQSLDLYESTVHEDDRLIFSTRSGLFRHLSAPHARSAPP